MRERLQKIRNRINHFLKRIHIPGYKPLTAFDFTRFYWHALTRGKITNRAASVTFYFIISLFPLLIFLFSLIPFIPIDGLQDSLLVSFKKILPSPEVYGFFEDVLQDLLLKKRTVLLSFSFILGIYFASNAVYAILNGLNDSYHLATKGKFLSRKLWSIAVLIAFMLLSIISFLLSGLTSYLIYWLHHHHILSGAATYYILHGISFILSFFTFLLAISILYNVANTEKGRWKFFSAGAVASTLLIFMMKGLFGWYLTSFNSYSKLYGPLGAGLAFLLFIYYIIIMLLIGFDMNISLQKAFRKSQEANPAV